MTNNEKCVQVCQNRTCRKQGAKEVLAAFEATPVPGVEVKGCSCLGQCGNGPMVLVLPDMVWYAHLQASEVSSIVEKHLLCGQPVTKMLYHRFHVQR
jgi:(2Fe-2S) ferredoxin